MHVIIQAHTQAHKMCVWIPTPRNVKTQTRVHMQTCACMPKDAKAHTHINIHVYTCPSTLVQ